LLYLQITNQCLTSHALLSDSTYIADKYEQQALYEKLPQDITEEEEEEDDDDNTDSSNLSLQDEIAKLKEPDFLLIGVVKSGSTSLYHYIMQHPEISGVESEYLLPEAMRNKITNIINLRRKGKIPKIQKPKLSKMKQLTDGQSKIRINPGNNVKDSIYEINNFDLARMIKPIIDQKEVRFFDSFWYNHLQTITNQSLLKAWKWYLQVFNQDPSAPDNLLRGEASPTYFASSQFTAERIVNWLPNIKLILLLRNPVRRFVSHLKMIKENHAANMKFRKMRQIENREKALNKTISKTMSKPDLYTQDIDLDGIRRRLLEMEHAEEDMDNLYDMDIMDEMEQYNPFNSPYNPGMMDPGMMNQQMMPNGALLNMQNGYNMPFMPSTRYGSKTKYGMRGKKNRMAKFMRTGRQFMNDPRYQSLINQYQNMLAQQQELENNWLDTDKALDEDDDDEDEIDELNEDDILDESEDGFDDDINTEILFNERVRERMKQRQRKKRKPFFEQGSIYDQEPNYSSPKTPKQGKKKPVNKMEKIIGAIYKLSMYQVILVSNANPDSSTFYCKRWGIARDVSGFINRLLFGGIYTMRMKEWLKRFDSDHLFYRESSALFEDPVKLMTELETFLGVTPFGEAKWANITKKVYNVKLEKGKGYGNDVKDADEIEHWDISVDKETKIPHPTENRKWQSLEIIDMLRDYYIPHNQQLSDLFDGVKYPNWDY